LLFRFLGTVYYIFICMHSIHFTQKGLDCFLFTYGYETAHPGCEHGLTDILWFFFYFCLLARSSRKRTMRWRRPFSFFSAFAFLLFGLAGLVVVFSPLSEGRVVAGAGPGSGTNDAIMDEFDDAYGGEDTVSTGDFSGDHVVDIRYCVS
jgi:hypothetical protein